MTDMRDELTRQFCRRVDEQLRDSNAPQRPPTFVFQGYIALVMNRRKGSEVWEWRRSGFFQMRFEALEWGLENSYSGERVEISVTGQPQGWPVAHWSYTHEELRQFLA